MMVYTLYNGVNEKENTGLTKGSLYDLYYGTCTTRSPCD